MSRHARIRERKLFVEQARIRSLAAVIADDCVYILERQDIDHTDPDFIALEKHGLEVLAKRVDDNIERLRRSLTLVRRLLRAG